MATYYPTSTNHPIDVFPSSYLSTQQQQQQQQQIDAYQGSSCPPIDMMYQNQNSTDASFLELLSGNTQTNTHSLSQVENHRSLEDERNLQYQELSLSLGMQITSSSMDLPSFQYNYLNQHLADSGDRGGNKVENVDYLSYGMVGGVAGIVKDRSSNNGQCSISGAYQIPTGVVTRIHSSRYLKPSQELLEEVANLHEAIRQLKMNRRNILHSNHGVVDRSDDNNSRINGMSSDPLESATSSSGELSASAKQDLQNKVAKLFSLLDEVDRKYREYCQQLRIVEAALDMVAGCGAARSYTALAHQTISRHFRCLRDAVNAQIQTTRQTLGEQDDSSDRVLPRLRNVEKQLRQQRSLHPLGVMRHSWRPQRGLPEGSVSILRAWLFEHFLNPYPKDSEKMMLARQTGLTRSQIANWFINARVRLWKPMVEDMYKEEFRDQELNRRSSSPTKPGIDMSSSSEDKEKELGSMAAHGLHGQSSGSNTEFVNEMEANGYMAQRHVDLADQYRFNDPQMLPDYVV